MLWEYIGIGNCAEIPLGDGDKILDRKEKKGEALYESSSYQQHCWRFRVIVAQRIVGKADDGLCALYGLWKAEK